jgi:hypothetical protein
MQIYVVYLLSYVISATLGTRLLTNSTKLIQICFQNLNRSMLCAKKLPSAYQKLVLKYKIPSPLDDSKFKNSKIDGKAQFSHLQQCFLGKKRKKLR